MLDICYFVVRLLDYLIVKVPAHERDMPRKAHGNSLHERSHPVFVQAQLAQFFFFRVASCDLIGQQLSFNILRFLRFSLLIILFYLLFIFI